MSVEYIKGDLLSWPAGITVICHGANAYGAAGAGFAAQVAKRYPDSREAYGAWCFNAAGGLADLGTFLVTKVGEDQSRRIVWLVTQQGTGTDRRQLNYEALYAGLEVLKQLLEAARAEGREWVLGLPMWIGCGLAGGAPAIVQAIVEHHFFQSPVRCVVVEYDSATGRTTPDEPKEDSPNA